MSAPAGRTLSKAITTAEAQLKDPQRPHREKDAMSAANECKNRVVAAATSSLDSKACSDTMVSSSKDRLPRSGQEGDAGRRGDDAADNCR